MLHHICIYFLLNYRRILFIFYIHLNRFIILRCRKTCGALQGLLFFTKYRIRRVWNKTLQVAVQFLHLTSFIKYNYSAFRPLSAWHYYCYSPRRSASSRQRRARRSSTARRRQREGTSFAPPSLRTLRTANHPLTTNPSWWTMGAACCRSKSEGGGVLRSVKEEERKGWDGGGEQGGRSGVRQHFCLWNNFRQTDDGRSTHRRQHKLSQYFS